MKYSIILSNNERSYEYLRILIKNNKIPSVIIHLDFKNINIFRKKILNLINNNKINYKSFKSDNIDKKNIEKFIINLRDKIIIYSGYGGKIIKNRSVLKKKILLHSHTGKLPNYKGSTTIYYSLINERKIFCTTFIMNQNIDKGKILLIKRYPFLKNNKSIDSYDNKIRAENILAVLNNFNRLNKNKKIYKDNFSSYYIIHPILRYLALKKIIF